MRLRRLLEWWAEWEGRQQNSVHYTHTVWTSAPSGNFGPRILCLDPPGPVWKASQAIAQLPLPERQAIHWRYLEGKPVSQYRTILRRAHNRLNARLFA